MKFRYYIVDELNGDVKGTNDTEVAENLSRADDFWVIDTETGQYLLMNTIGERFDIPEVRSE